ncbi:MAG: twitching motility protein PilT [Monoglobales bacterium]
MIKSIVGKKGTGKTNKLIAEVNEAVKTDKGHLVFINDTSRHMFDLDYKVRLVDTQEYAIKNYDALYGMICGILSQDYDISSIFIDSVTKIVKDGDIFAAGDIFEDIADVCEKHNVKLTITARIDTAEVPEYIKKYL